MKAGIMDENKIVNEKYIEETAPNNKDDKKYDSPNNKHTIEDLRRLQALPLEEKVLVTQTRLIEWYTRNNNMCYVSFSGGKDSTALAYVAAQVCDILKCKLVLWFSDTGLEFPEVRQHVKKYGDWLKTRFPDLDIETVIDYPKISRGKDKGKRITFRQVIEKWGYPIITKEVSRCIYDARSAMKNGNEDKSWAMKQLNGKYINKLTGDFSDRYNKEKWRFLLNSDFKISNRCCDVMKKRPAHHFNKKYGRVPIIGSMATESQQRKTQWLLQGCNSFDSKNPSSKPISFWKEQDVLAFLVKYDIPYPSVYGEIKQNEKGEYYTTGLDRTGCVFCGFGCHLEKEPNRFQRLKVTHPKLWEYCMKPWDEGGLGMKHVLDYIGVKTE